MNQKFKAVQWMRQVRTEIDSDDSDLSWKEKMTLYGIG